MTLYVSRPDIPHFGIRQNGARNRGLPTPTSTTTAWSLFLLMAMPTDETEPCSVGHIGDLLCLICAKNTSNLLFIATIICNGYLVMYYEFQHRSGMVWNLPYSLFRATKEVTSSGL